MGEAAWASEEPAWIAVWGQVELTRELTGLCLSVCYSLNVEELTVHILRQEWRGELLVWCQWSLNTSMPSSYQNNFERGILRGTE